MSREIEYNSSQPWMHRVEPSQKKTPNSIQQAWRRVILGDCGIDDFRVKEYESILSQIQSHKRDQLDYMMGRHMVMTFIHLFCFLTKAISVCISNIFCSPPKFLDEILSVFKIFGNPIS